MKCLEKRPYRLFEGIHLYTGTVIQLGVKVSDARYIPQLIEEASKMSVGLHVRRVGNEIWRTNEPPIIINLPTWIESVEDACQWTAQQKLPSSTRCSNLSVGQNILILNSNHMAADGGFFKQVLTRFQESLAGIPAKRYPQTLISSEDYYRVHEIEAGKPFNHSGCTCVMTDCKEGVHDKAETFVWAFKFPTKELNCFDKAKGRPSSLTEAIWSSYILSALAFNGKLGTMRCETCCDLRKTHQFMPEVACDFTIAAPEAVCKPTETVADMGKQIRNDLQQILGSNRRFAFWNQDLANYKPIAKGCALEISHLGTIAFKKPIIDACMQIMMESKQTEEVVSLLTFSKVNEDHDDFYGRLRCSPHRLNVTEGRILGMTVEHALKNISPKMTIQEAFDELVRFQHTLVH